MRAAVTYGIRSLVLLMAAGCAAILLALIQPADAAQAATITVTRGIKEGFDPDQTGCSWAEAIANANANSQVSTYCPAGDPAPTVDVITFNIPGEVAHTICGPTSGCADIEADGGPVFVDGYSQPGSHSNTNPIGQPSNAVILLEMFATGPGTGAGVAIKANGSSVRGLRISGSRAGMSVQAKNVSVQGNQLMSLGFAIPLRVLGQSAQIGGATPEARNLICGSGLILELGADNARIQGNDFGTGVPGDQGACGTTINVNGANGTIIGGLGTGEGNAMNLANVLVVAGTGTTIRGNRFPGTVPLPIDLGNNGATPNDPGDFDTGPNDLQNFPILTTARPVNGAVTVTGTLNSTPGTSFSVDLYTGPTCGDSFLTTTTVSTDGSGNGSFTLNGLTGVSPSGFVVATATDPGGNTSEYSPCVQVIAPAVNVIPTRVTIAEGGSQPFALGLNSVPTAPVTVTFAYDTSQLTVSPPSVTFQPNATALDAQQVTVTAKNDTILQGNRTLPIHLSASSADAGFNGLAVSDVSATITDDDSPAACSPRPPVVVRTSAENGSLRVTVATSSGPGLTNALKALTWTSLSNATVTVDGIGPATQGTTTAFQAGVQGAVFHVQRVTPGQAANVRFTVTDACGTWSTFVGGGPNSF